PGNQLDCVTNMILLTSADNPGQGIEHSWTDDSGAEVGTNSTFNASQAGTYTHTATNLTNGCTATDQFVITQSGDLPQLSVDRTYELSCDSTSLDISVEVDNFNGPVDFNWTGPNGTMGMDATLSGVTAPGAYTVTAFRPDNMCSGMLTINVTQNIASPTATLTSDGDLNCRDTETFVRATANPNYIYSWTTANGSIVAGADAEAARVAAGTYSLMVTDQTNGCSDDFSVSVGTDLRTLSPNAGMDQLLPCNNPAFAINGTANPALAGTTFRWFDETGSILATTADYTPPGVGIYELEVTHPESFCTSSDFVEITSEGPFAARLDITPPPCRDVGGQLRLLSVEGGVGPYTIDPGVGVPDPADPDRFLDILPGNYTYTVTDVNGCSFQEQFEVSADGEFTGTTSPIRIRIGESAALGAVINRPDDQISSYNWTATESQQLSCTDCPNPTVISTTSFVASVAIVDTFGCTLELLQQVFVDARQVVYMPNAFSPRDGNGVNDNFTLYGNPNLIDAIEYLAIFDRWGNDVWTATELPINDASQGWDGTFAGKPLNPQVLVFTGRVRLFDGTYREVQGSLTLTN
ncbi:MAG: gliding motility-associated C-terminal domain-containing protein, partial [Bacteroidota bacterium]